MTGLFLLTMDQTEFTKEEAMHVLYNMGVTDLPEADRGKNYSGRLLFSQALPKGLNAEYTNNTARVLRQNDIPKDGNEHLYKHALVKIEDGNVVSGIVDSTPKLVETIVRNYSPETLERYYYAMSHVVHELMTMKGVTIGVEEFNPVAHIEAEREKAIAEELKEGTELAEKYAAGKLEPIPGRSA